MQYGTVRDYVGHGPEPRPGRWPNGSPVAVSLVLNIEDGAERSTARGDIVDDVHAHWVRHRVAPGQRSVTLESAFDYGSRAGIWRVLRALREFGAPATAFCCAVALELNPPLAAALVAGAYEIANHGLRWETHTHLDADGERAKIRASSDLIEVATGQRPRCWYSRDGISPWTRAAMLDEGCHYDSNSFCDDLPYTVAVGDRSLAVVPYAGDTNDSGLLSQFRTGRQFGGYLRDSLAMLIDDPRPGLRVLSVGLHPRLIGRPASIGGLRTFLQYAQDERVWVATRSDIAAHWRQSAER